MSLLFFFKIVMIDKTKLKDFIENSLKDTDLFLVDLKIGSGNQIEVEIDSDEPVSIDMCERLTRAIESEFDRDDEDYTLEVGSSGLTTPFKVKRQYLKKIGHEVEVLTREGKKIVGLLKEADDDGFTVTVKEKVKKPDQKRPVMEDVDQRFGYSEIKQTKYLLKF